MKGIIRAKRCKDCDKILRWDNKTELCAYHYRKRYYKNYKKESSSEETNEEVK